MTVWERDPRTLWRRSGARTVLLAPASLQALVIEGVGTVTWELLAAPRHERELRSLVAAAYDVDAATVARALSPFLEELRCLQAVRRS